MSAYYNEIDPKAAAWLRELIKRGLIADGEVDERSIEDVSPADLAGFRQCHFFAGIGGWSYALRRAAWPDARPVWTGSCPCQPFSAAGKGAGFADERHLWPAFHHLIRQCRPSVVFGEQVASKDGLAWLDLVSADMEGTDYAFGAVDTCAAGFGAPHIRQRLYFAGVRLGDALGAGLEGHGGNGDDRREPGRLGAVEAGHAAASGGAGRVADADEGQRGRVAGDAIADGAAGGRDEGDGQPSGAGAVRGLAIAEGDGRQQRWTEPSGRGTSSGCMAGGVADANGGDASAEGLQRSWQHGQRAQDNGTCQAERPGPVHGFWRDADWLFCRDDKLRPVEPGTFPLAHGLPDRVGRLRGYGNAINAEQAAAFIETVMEKLT